MKILNHPLEEPVTLEQAKFAARLTGISAFDSMLPIYIAAAREIAEKETGVRWVSQAWREVFTDWPSSADMINLAGPTAVAVSYWSTDNTWTTLAGSEFVWIDHEPGVTLVPAQGKVFPDLGEVGGGHRVRVDVTVGATDVADIPASIKAFIMGMVSYWVEHPRAFVEKPHLATPASLSLLETQRVAY